MSQDWSTNGVSQRERLLRWSMAGVALLATLGGIIVFGIGKIGVCLYDYQVHVKSASVSTIKNVRGMAFEDPKAAHEVAANPKAEFSILPDEKGMNFNGKSLRVNGLYTCNSYCLDLIQTRSPPCYLVLLVDYADGKRENKLVEIPPGPGTQRLLVEVP
jgi:hypothetical protein